MAMIGNSLAPHGKIIMEPLVQRLMIRWFLDRCCKKHLRKKTNIEGTQGNEEEEDENEGGSRRTDSVDDILYEGGPSDDEGEKKDGDDEKEGDEEDDGKEKPTPDTEEEIVGEDDVETRVHIF